MCVQKCIHSFATNDQTENVRAEANVYWITYKWQNNNNNKYPQKSIKTKKKYLSFVKANDNAFLTMLCISIRQRVLLSCLKRVSDKFSKYISLIYCFETRSIEWKGEKKIISEEKKTTETQHKDDTQFICDRIVPNIKATSVCIRCWRGPTYIVSNRSYKCHYEFLCILRLSTDSCAFFYVVSCPGILSANFVLARKKKCW